jgi:RNA polymerase sigma-B factor
VEIPSRLDDRALLAKYRDEGDEGARTELVERYMPLAKRLAARYKHTREPIEDLVQVASVALLGAIERFDLDRETSFSAFAVPTILGELKRHFRDHGWFLHVPRDLQERSAKVSRALDSLTTRRGHQPSVQELADKLDLDLEEVLEAMEARQAYDALSIDAPHRGADGDELTYADSLGKEDDRLELVDDKVAVSDALQKVSERERRLLHLRFQRGMTQSQIAERLGVSQMQVSRLLRQTLQRLREIAGEGD